MGRDKGKRARGGNTKDTEAETSDAEVAVMTMTQLQPAGHAAAPVCLSSGCSHLRSRPLSELQQHCQRVVPHCRPSQYQTAARTGASKEASNVTTASIRMRTGRVMSRSIPPLRFFPATASKKQRSEARLRRRKRSALISVESSKKFPSVPVARILGETSPVGWGGYTLENTPVLLIIEGA